MRSILLLTILASACTTNQSSQDDLRLSADITSSQAFDTVTVSTVENPDAKEVIKLDSQSNEFHYAVDHDAGASLVVVVSLGDNVVAHGELAEINYVPQADGSMSANIHMTLVEGSRSLNGGEHFDRELLPNGSMSLSGGTHLDRGAL
ncbi:MAG: hypothetical protein QM831_44770 [Kofleriaceae bacterium]